MSDTERLPDEVEARLYKLGIGSFLSEYKYFTDERGYSWRYEPNEQGMVALRAAYRMALQNAIEAFVANGYYTRADIHAKLRDLGRIK